MKDAGGETGSGGSLEPIGRELAGIGAIPLTHVRRYWALWLAIVFVGTVAWLGLETGIQRLLGRWIFPYNHSFLVLGMAAWLLVAGLRGATIERIGPSVLGFFALLFAVAAYALTEAIDFTLGMQVLLPVVLLAIIMALAGRAFAAYAVIPVAMLYFTIPIWDLTVGVLQDISTWVVTSWLRWTGITAHIDGYLITIRAGAFEIAEGCSGMRYVMVSMALAAFFAFAWLQRWRSRLLLLVMAAILSMVANWVRIYTLVLIGDWTAMEHYLIAESHDGYGWVVFALFMLPLFLFARWLEGRESTLVDPRQGPARVGGVAPASTFLLAGVLASALVAGPVALRGGADVPETPDPLVLIPEPASSWQAVPPAQDWQPDYHLPHALGHQGYVANGGVQVDAFIARYRRQGPASKLIAFNNSLWPGWHGSGSRNVTIDVSGASRQLQATQLSAGRAQRLVWNWYVVGGWPTADRVQAKILEVPALLTGRRDAAVIAVSARCAVTCDEAEIALREFVQAHGARLEAVANGAADSGS